MRKPPPLILSKITLQSKWALVLMFLTCLLFPAPQLLLPSASAQTGTWLWGRANRGGPVDAYTIAADGLGNVYCGGTNIEDSAMLAQPDTFGSVTLPDSATGSAISPGYCQAVWAKYSANGTPLWAGGTQHAYAWLSCLTVDSNGDLIIFGWFYSPVCQIGATTLTNANYDTAAGNQYFIAKYNAAGTFLWAISDGEVAGYGEDILGIGIINTDNVTTDAAGDIYITSYFRKRTISIGPYTLINSDTSGTTSDIYVAKYSPSGTLIWATRFGGSSEEFADGITVAKDGDIYITGAFSSPSLTVGSSVISNPYAPNGIPLAYLAELSPSGAPLWAQEAGGRNGAYGAGLTTDSAGNMYITGGFGDSSISFGAATITRTRDNATASFPKTAAFLVQYSPAHTATWGKVIESDSGDAWGYSVAPAPCGAVWVSGGYVTDVYFDGNKLSAVAGHDPAFIAGYDPSGGVIGYSRLGSGGEDGNAIVCDAHGNVFICGDYEADAPFSIGSDTLCTNTAPVYGEYLYIGKYNTKDTVFSHQDTLACNDTSVGLSAPAGYATYYWDNASTLPLRVITHPGTYWVICNTACNESALVDTFYINFGNRDTTNLHSDTAFCNTDTAFTLNGDVGFNTYYWSTGSTAISVNLPGAGVYWVNETNGCKLQADTFGVSVKPTPFVHMGNDTTVCDTVRLLLHSPEPAGTSYLWSNGSTDSSIVISEAGSYALTVNDNGCFAAGAISVEVIYCGNIIIPDGISPNGDGINDVWVIEGINGYPNNSVRIFDKWGDLVYEKTNYSNDFGGKGKDGNLPDGTYYYLIKLNAANDAGDTNKWTGTLLIKR